MSTFSRTHAFASGAAAFLPAGGHEIHGKTGVTFWSDDGLTYTLRITRPGGVPIDAIIPATPNHYVAFDLHPDEGFNVEASSVGGSTINVMVV
tara:strand:- start:1 stop:279 length:279 start_codon:yes stop_codon:yes gene_type:complete